MAYPLLDGETTAMMWNATGHGWNHLQKIKLLKLKDHLQPVFEKGVPASILVWTLTLSVNRAWLLVRSG